VVSKLTPLVLAIAAALLLAALLEPVVEWLHRHRVPRGLAAFIAVVAGIVAVLGALLLVGYAVASEAAELGRRVGAGLREIRDWLVEGPLKLDPQRLDSLLTSAGERAQQLAPASLRGAVALLEVLGSAVLAVVLLFFLLKDGPMMWRWVVGGVAEHNRERVDRAGHSGWRALTGYVRGIVVIAAIDAIGIGIALWLIGVPLAFPLGVLTFLASFVPVLGATVAGAVAVLVALAANGPVDALLVLAAVIVVQQAEGNLLEPLIMGRAVRLHPAVILTAVAAGTLLAGVGGALLATPVVAVTYRVIQSFRERPSGEILDS
jgi:putative heme transporter